jgi:hypothetical protein
MGAILLAGAMNELKTWALSVLLFYSNNNFLWVKSSLFRKIAGFFPIATFVLRSLSTIRLKKISGVMNEKRYCTKP